MKKKTSTRTYGAYLFKDKDPIIDETRTLLEDVFGQRVNNKMFVKISEDGGPTVSCMRGWFFGDIRRPKNETIEATGRAVGYRRRWVKMK
jgi:hypothetical protein